MHISKSITGICEAQGCCALAEEAIRVPVGHIGEIDVVICRKCKPKFTTVNASHLEKKQHSESMVGSPDQSPTTQNSPRTEPNLND